MNFEVRTESLAGTATALGWARVHGTDEVPLGPAARGQGVRR